MGSLLCCTPWIRMWPYRKYGSETQSPTFEGVGLKCMVLIASKYSHGLSMRAPVWEGPSQGKGQNFPGMVRPHSMVSIPLRCLEAQGSCSEISFNNHCFVWSPACDKCLSSLSQECNVTGGSLDGAFPNILSLSDTL